MCQKAECKFIEIIEISPLQKLFIHSDKFGVPIWIEYDIGINSIKFEKEIIKSACLEIEYEELIVPIAVQPLRICK